MGAYSVSGVGPGSALSQGQQGAENMFLGVGKLIGTRVVFTGQVVMTGSTQTVKFPQVLPGLSTDYIVLCGMCSSYSYASNFTTSSFTMNGTSSQTVGYAVISVTNSTLVPDTFQNTTDIPYQ